MKQFVKKRLAMWLAACLFFALPACNGTPAGTVSIPNGADASQSGPNGTKGESAVASTTGMGETSDLSKMPEGEKTMKIQIGDTVLTATLADNTSSNALLELLANGPISIEMEDYGNMEKVGDIGTSLPRNDEQTTTQAGDLILYQGRSFVIYYAPNTWNFTRLGKIENITGEELLKLLGDGSVVVTLSLE